MKILYAEDEELLRELFAMEIEAELGVKVIECKSGSEAVLELQKTSDISLILSDFNMPNGNGDLIYNYIIKNNLQIPFVLLTALPIEQVKTMQGFLDERETNYFLNKPAAIEKIIEIIDQSCSPESKKENQPPSNFVKIRPKRLGYFNTVNCDIFIQLGPKKYIKIINKGDLYDSDLVEKYRNKGLDYFYLKKEDFDIFSESFSKNLSLLLNDSKMSSEKKQKIQLIGTNFIHEQIDALGISEAVVENVNSVVQSIHSNLSEDKSIGDYIKSILSKDNYLSEHGLLISYVAGQIAFKMDWKTPVTIHKLSTTAILHDIGLEEHSNLVEKHDCEPESVAEKEAVKKHCVKGAETVRACQDLPADVDRIILEHHEKPDGSGYPKGLNGMNISPLSCVFILSEHLVTQMFNSDIPIKDRAESLKKFYQENYNSGNFKKPLQGLIKLLDAM